MLVRDHSDQRAEAADLRLQGGQHQIVLAPDVGQQLLFEETERLVEEFTVAVVCFAGVGHLVENGLELMELLKEFLMIIKESLEGVRVPGHARMQPPPR